MVDAMDALGRFSEPVRQWFTTTFRAPTPPQVEGWPAIADGDHTLILAPTGTGKTLSAFLWALDRLSVDPVPEDEQARTRVVYLSPLRALAVDVEKNLRAPLQGIGFAAERLGADVHIPTVGIRTGDTPTRERRQLVRHPPDILITTPESLYLMLTSQARETLGNVQHVIIDEIHAMAGTKRGAHLMLSLERLEERTAVSPQRIALSATQRPLDEIARFLGGADVAADGTLTPRPVTVVDAGARKELDIEVVVPIEDMGALGERVEAPIDGPAAASPGRRSIWPSMHPRLLELVETHRSTLIFSNARRLSERLATRLNELAIEARHREDGTPLAAPPVIVGAADEQTGRGAAEGEELVKAHHGSLSRERRLQIEDELKRGDLKGLVATSSLELGIDMGAVDLVVQVASPGSVASGMQRIGRAGHQVGEPSRGKIFPKHRADLLEAAVVVDRMHQGLIEETRYPRNPLDVLAQQIVAMCAMDDWDVDELSRVVRRSANFADLSDEVLGNVLDLLSGTYPSEEFSELRPRIVYDRVTGTLRGRKGSQRLAVTNAGTIPDRGLFGVFLPDGTRVGELDEEMVYESRVGETFLLGASTWRIEDITFERVVVTPAPGQPGKMPFWHGDGPGRPLELGRAIGAFVREIRTEKDPLSRLRERHGLDELSAQNLMGYLDEQFEVSGAIPDDQTVVVERFRDEIGDWRVCILTPFGAQVHAPWGMALQARLGEEWGTDVELMWSDDGIVMRLPEAMDQLPVDELLFDPDEIDELIISRLPDTAMFASRFRECSARALLLPRRRPDQRTPLWQQRQRAADLLSVAAKYPSFPMLLEATRECVNDVFDLPAVREVMRDLRSRRIRVVPVDTPKASPFAQSLLFSWIAVYMYEGDAPIAERRAAALALDRDLLRDLLGAEELRELLSAEVLADVELELQCLVDGRKARDRDELHDLLRRLGPLSLPDLDARAVDGADVSGWVRQLLEERRAFEVRIGDAAGGGADRIAASDDAARLRDAVGAALPVGLPAVFTDPVDDPLGDLCSRYARTHGPFLARDIARWLGITVDRVTVALERLLADGRVVRGEFRPGGIEREYCDDDVLRQLRRRSLAVLRHEIEPVEAEALARFLPAWQGVGSRRRGVDGLAEVVTQLQGAPIAASVLEVDVLPARVGGYQPSDLDTLCTTGEVVWVGAGAVGATDGRVRLLYRDQVGLLAPPADDAPAEPIHDTLRSHLGSRGASFWPELVAAVAAAELPYDEVTVLAALWDLVWAGEVTNDTLAPLRAMVAGTTTKSGGRAAAGGRRRRARPGGLNRLGPPAAAGRWSLVAPLRSPVPTPTETAHARAHQLLDRYGVLTREAALGEGHEGGFAGVYPLLKALEERGEVRRGYFVAGLGAAQFALPGAVDRLRAVREVDVDTEPLVLAATDPAQPYGAAVAWPESAGRPVRAAGALVVLQDGRPLVELERGGKSLITFPGAADGPAWIGALQELVKNGRLKKLEIAKVDGVSIRETEWAARLESAGFSPGYRGMTFRG
ncbi:MAG: DEAD/DEAH box helicase [Acidimicrobiales bacterium]|nr:DEAD/DEAH box helicase [Acidimicrobiales bacterium]